MNVAILVTSSVACVASVTTLIVVLVGAKRMEEEMEAMKEKTNKNVNKLKAALYNISEL